MAAENFVHLNTTSATFSEAIESNQYGEWRQAMQSKKIH